MELEATNQVADDGATLEDTNAAPGVEAEGQTADDQQFDEDGNEIAQAPEEEEVELDDLKLKVPKDQAQKLKDAFLRQADYTRKTQEVAELRKAVEAERTSLHQSSEAEVAALADVRAIDQQLAYYGRIDWDAYEQQDAFAAQTDWRKFQQLQNARAQSVGQYSHLKSQRELAAQQDTAKRIEEGRAVLAREIPGWGPEKAETLLSTATTAYKFTRSEAEETITDPRLMVVLNDAAQWRAHQAKQTKVQNHVAAQAVEPAAKPVAARSGPPAGLDDRLDVDEWARRRNEQVRKRGRR
jgi:hypothetical protein